MLLSNEPAVGPLDPAVLPVGVASRFVETATGLTMHILEAGADAQRPLVLLLHGFPELAFSWRKVMPMLADAGFHVVAPDQRGYGRTTGWDGDYDGDLRSFEILPLVRDVLALVEALGRTQVECLVAHDFGAVVAPWCALTRPDVFRSLVIMSVPFAGPPALGAAQAKRFDMPGELARLDPPRKHYQWYNSTRAADRDMRECRQGLHALLRAYYHMKSADWPANKPFALASWDAREFAKLPRYYVMDRDADIAETVAPSMPLQAQIAGCAWLTEAELAVYTQEFTRTGFQGALNWYRCRTETGHTAELEIFAGKTLDMPSLYIAGVADWGTRQTPGAFEAMQTKAFTRLAGCRLIEGAGHWVQQEQPQAVGSAIIDFIASNQRTGPALAGT